MCITYIGYESSTNHLNVALSDLTNLDAKPIKNKLQKLELIPFKKASTITSLGSNCISVILLKSSTEPKVRKLEYNFNV